MEVLICRHHHLFFDRLCFYLRVGGARRPPAPEAAEHRAHPLHDRVVPLHLYQGSTVSPEDLFELEGLGRIDGFMFSKTVIQLSPKVII